MINEVKHRFGGFAQGWIWCLVAALMASFGTSAAVGQPIGPGVPIPAPDYPIVDLQDGVDKVVLITHGVLTGDGFGEVGGWGHELAEVIRDQVPSDGTWQVATVHWGFRVAPAPNVDEAIETGRAVGGQLTAHGVTQLHVIGHSLGAYVIDGIAAAVREQSPSTVIQSTYLDAFTALFDYATLAARGSTATHADSYYTSGSDLCHLLTQEVFPNCINADVTGVHPWLDVIDDPLCLGSHEWPRCFYHRTVDPSGGPCVSIDGNHGGWGDDLALWQLGNLDAWQSAMHQWTEGQDYDLPEDGDDPGFTDDPINAVLYEREDSSIENLESCLVGDDPGSNVIVDGGSVTLTDDLDHQFTQVAFQMCGSIVGPVNRIRFNCESIDSDCSGVLSTHVNGRWQSQHCEQYWEGESRTIDVYLDHMTSGEVPISFGFILSCEEDGAHSTIRVSDIRTGLAEARSACAADMTSLDSEYPQPDGVVDIADLLAALDHWGACDQDCSLAGCSGDVDFDCDVDGSDLLNLLDAWGPCY